MKRLSLVVLLAALSGCGVFQKLGIGTEDFTATLCASGAVVVPCTVGNLGKVSLPSGGAMFAGLFLDLAAPYLAKSVNLKGCVFTATFPGEGPLSATATANCTLNGQMVSEALTLTLAPIVPAVT